MKHLLLMRLSCYQIDLLAILQKSLDRALFLHNFIREVIGNPLLSLRSEIRSFPSQMIDLDPFFVSFINDQII